MTTKSEMTIRISRLLATALPTALCSAAFALAMTLTAAEPQNGTYTDPDKVPASYAMQGEYVGDGKVDGVETKMGVQVIALGDDKYDVVGYFGGLPGAGWKRGEHSVHGSGQLKDGKVVFQSPEEADIGVLSDGVILVKSKDGKIEGSLKKVVRKSPTLGQAPPEGAMVLFNGKDKGAFVDGKLTDDGLLMADCITEKKFGDHMLHVEFRTPYMPAARGQGRGNSGVYLQGRYELQVLDSFGLDGKDNECGGIYSISPPDVNACLPPLTWQTYDIDFKQAVYDDAGKKTAPARVTIKHNGIVIHDDRELAHGTPGKFAEAPGPEKIYLQGHGNPVVYRNIWVVESK